MSQCFGCDTSLAGKSYTTHGARRYCEQCYKEKFAHKCAVCEQLIAFGSTDVGLEDGKHYHKECFVCSKCGASIEKSFHEHEGKFVCSPCYDQTLAKRCAKCQEIISGKYTQFRDKPFHDACFTCTKCHERLLQKFQEKAEEPYCANCHRELFAPRCYQCHEPIDDNWIEMEQHPYHKACFKCYGCGEALEKFYQVDSHPYCRSCAEGEAAC